MALSSFQWNGFVIACFTKVSICEPLQESSCRIPSCKFKWAQFSFIMLLPFRSCPNMFPVMLYWYGCTICCFFTCLCQPHSFFNQVFGLSLLLCNMLCKSSKEFPFKGARALLWVKHLGKLCCAELLCGLQFSRLMGFFIQSLGCQFNGFRKLRFLSMLFGVHCFLNIRCFLSSALLCLAWLGLAWLGLAWLGLAWLGLAWLGLAWFGLAWLGSARLGLAWLGLACLGLAVPSCAAYCFEGELFLGLRFDHICTHLFITPESY